MYVVKRSPKIRKSNKYFNSNKAAAINIHMYIVFMQHVNIPFNFARRLVCGTFCLCHI